MHFFRGKLFLIIIMVMCITFVGCQSNTATIEITEKLPSQTEKITEETIEETTEGATANENQYYDPSEFIIEYDYSNLGFENTYGYDTWIKIKGYSFSGDESYIYVSDGDYTTLHFNNGFLKQLRWDRNDNGDKMYDLNDGGIGGYVFNTVNYGIVDNDTISFTSGYYNGSTFYINSRDIVRGIPVLDCEFHSTSRHQVYDDGWYVPTAFIDWEKSPERGTHTKEDGNTITVIKYYIDENYIKE